MQRPSVQLLLFLSKFTHSSRTLFPMRNRNVLILSLALTVGPLILERKPDIFPYYTSREPILNYLLLLRAYSRVSHPSLRTHRKP